MLRQAAILSFTLLLSLSSLACSPTSEESADAAPTPTPWIEPNFPFFSSVLDLRDFSAPDATENNLVPRGLILSLGPQLWACFDLDLLRIACIWQGKPDQPPITLNALAPGSYHIAGQKTKDGQEFLPKPIGRVLFTNGIHPGLQSHPHQLTDPRPAPFSKQEIGRGALPTHIGKFLSLTTSPDRISLNLNINGIDLTTSFPHPLAHPDHSGFTCELPAHQQPLAFLLGKIPPTPLPSAPADPTAPPPPAPLPPSLSIHTSHGSSPTHHISGDGLHYLIIPASTNPQKFRVQFTVPNTSSTPTITKDFPTLRWNTSTPITSSATLSTKTDAAYVSDEIHLPSNPWNRKLRLADLTFLDDQGNAAAVTFDGDIWLISGLHHDLTQVTWKRYTSGLHEPMSIVARGQDLFVFDRNGIWQILDLDQNGEADTHRLFCNLFTQTAETREFPNSMKLGPDGSFYLAKGGQQGTTIGKDNGTVLRVAPDGKSYQVIGYGLRQPFIGVHPQTGLVTASDQQGNYVPSTPFHLIRDQRYYGFLSDLLPKQKYPAPIAAPLSWIPHPVNPSGASQVWLSNANMGDLNNECIHIGYNRPELFRVLLDDLTNPTQATIVPFSRDLNLPPLNGTINPADGQLYLTGFQVWGTTANPISGLTRLRYTGKNRLLLKHCTPTTKGILLTFNQPLDPTSATNLSNYSVERWNYQRTPDYGSPHLKLDGQPGQDWMQPSSVYLSTDQKSLFLALPDMQPVMQMRIGWAIKSSDQLPAQNSAYFTPATLADFHPATAGFGNITIDLTPKPLVSKPNPPQEKPSAAQGQRIAEMFGCMACHSIDGSVVGKVGPSWKGLYKSKRTLKDGKTELRADEAYLHESIINPSAKVVKGYDKYDTGMPIYNGILNESQIQSLILYIKTL